MTQEKAIQEAKDRVAQKLGYNDYEDWFSDGPHADSEIKRFMDKAMLEYASSSREKGDVTEMALCEIDHLILHEDQLYRFKKHEGCRGCEEYNGVTHKSYKQFTLDKDFDKWIADNRYEWIRAQRGHFMWYKRFEGSLSAVIGKTTSEIYNEYKSLTPKEHSEGEGREVEFAEFAEWYSENKFCKWSNADKSVKYSRGVWGKQYTATELFQLFLTKPTNP